MMSHIPGGRPRASSDGDILDDGFCGAFFVNVIDGNGEVKARHGNTAAQTQKQTKPAVSSSHSCLDAEDYFDSDGETSSQSHSSSVTSRTRSNKSIFSFKSMRKAVSRRFVKESNSNGSHPASTKKTNNKSVKTPDLAKIWTPDLRNLGYSTLSVLNGKEHTLFDNSTMSTARPLITDPNVGMTVPKWKRTPGILGIYNHGNSCFMNAVLQCLSNTDSFTEYFVKDFYKGDLKNSKNGKKSVFRSTQGEVTEQLGILLKSLWSGKYNSDVSRDFKAVVGKFSSQYKGDHQHDAQEFLLWLLDRIHEDVCTYLKKKQKPQKPLVNKSDEEAASEASSVNGESFVVRLFQALHASTLTCPTCSRRKATFDPYLCVSLPLPQHCPRQVSVVLQPYGGDGGGGGRVHYDGGGGIRVLVTLNQYDTVGELKAKLCSEVADIIDVKARRLILVQLREEGFGSTYSNEQPVSDIGEGESLYALEASPPSQADGVDTDDVHDTAGIGDGGGIRGGGEEFDTPMAQVMVVHVEVSPGSNRSYRFGNPAMLKVRRDVTWKGLQKEILHRMGDAVYDEVLSQKLSALFTLRVFDGSSRRNSLSSDIEMPLYTQDVERAYETLDEDFGPLHVKLVAQWDFKTKKIIVADSREHIEIHRSVHEAQNTVPGQARVSLDECFKLYTQEEKLIGEDAWVCPHCKQHQQGTVKTLGLWSLPDILVLHLKRFKQTGLRRSKLNTLVDFPEEGLDMSPYLSSRKKGEGGKGSSSPSDSSPSSSSDFHKDDHTYDLLGVSNHYGNMMGGHYIAVCKSPVDGVWREFNDQRVRPLDVGEPIATKEAYLLFYQRRSLGKDINHRLFTGDHWAFSLSLAPTEVREDTSSSGGSTPRGEVIPHMPPPSHVSSLHPRRRSLPRSVSPSVLKQGRDHVTATVSKRSASSSRPLTPQPHRKPIVPYTESRHSDGDEENDHRNDSHPPTASAADTARRSRPVHRQVSEPGPRRVKRESNFAKVRDSLPKSSHDGRGQLDDHSNEMTITNGKSGRKSDSTVLTKPPHTNDKDTNPSVSAGLRLESQGSLDISSSLSSRRTVIPHSNSLESDAKYPSSYDGHSYLERTRLASFEPASALRVKLNDGIMDDITSHSLPPYSEMESFSAAAARKRLAERIDNRDSYARQSGRKFDTQKSYDLARQNLLDLDADLSNLRLSSGGLFNGHHHSLDFDRSKAEDQGRWDKPSSYGNHSNNKSSKHLHSNGYSRLDSDVEELEEEDEEDDEMVETLTSRPSLQSRLQNKYDTVMDLAEKHFGPRPYNKEKYVSLVSRDEEVPYTSSDYVSTLINGDLSRLSKYATVGRVGTTDHHRVAGSTSSSTRLQERDREVPHRDLPRSSTDYGIQYTLAAGELPAPPSPTPPRGLGEERTYTDRIMGRGGEEGISASSFAYSSSFPFSSSSAAGGKLSDRDIQAIQAYEYAGRRGVLDKEIGRRNGGARTLPAYVSDSGIRESTRHNFRPPRGTWGIYNPKPKDSPPVTIPTPCLRESSV